MKRIVFTALILVGCGLPLRAEIIDRILATVGGTLILQSDAVAAVRLGFLQVPSGQADPLQWALDRLIERRLMLLEVDRYGPPEPDRVEIDAQMAEIDKRFASGQQLDTILREAGLSVGQLRLHVRDELRLDAYLKQRFASTFQATDQEVFRYYQDHQADFTVGGNVLPFNDVREHARQAVIEQRRVAAIREWMAGLRRRTEVNVLYLPGR
jgi:hypothetical protein